MRISEVLGLRFDDIDVDGRAIQVDRQIVASTSEVGEAKTASSRRRVDIYSDVLLSALREEVQARKEENLKRAVELYGATRDLKYVAKQLGHKSTVVTEGSYLRFFDRRPRMPRRGPGRCS